MLCSRCGAENADDLRFCTACGAGLARPDTLDYAHAATCTDAAGREVRGVLHRDLKPANDLPPEKWSREYVRLSRTAERIITFLRGGSPYPPR